ncbi:mapkkk cascade protein kinase regulator ste50 [Histoplasma capsulatum G186AR]|uniref:Mapkkk cascade protein kinase regulator ste50 n=2 Tax=Ajellomyces capsulatus TaxID=5037 RepID=C0NF65_AJECG|nr:mapkkk cascade protein kinase regulator ste50 [Histoplasma capsulatum G186AR]EEH09886.1 mapkkk cascade protein kinase regulator ste50 [Histoplasma capsulatum G186AR]KAG5298907.1 mapkkk cascade protein kinase regulator ste50 [Histoplasma capsulatum]QSS73099.1 mapkkk cascade protein kinase regulator ste50 [Histoplasma capsulatum G186AR]
MAFQTPYHADSDADDEYERSVVTSPHIEDSETSPTDSELPSAEHTPTTFGNTLDDRSSPRTIITEWTAEECADFAAGLGLSQYCDAFLENEIVGEALIALKHEELKEMGISSVGHRLTILKSVYETKVKQGILLDADHYVPLSAEQSNGAEAATQDDISRIIQSIRLRDERIIAAEAELRKLADDYRKLREELLPVVKIAKDRSQPLPYQPNSTYSGTTINSEYHNHDPPTATPIITQQAEKPGNSLTRSFSKKLFAGGSTPKNNSPTHVPQFIPEGRPVNDNSLDPSAAAMAASSHLTASMSGGQPSPKGMPSPTSPGSFYPQQTLASRSYAREASNSSNRGIHDHSDELQSHQRPDRSIAATPSTQSSRQEPPSSATGNQLASRTPGESPAPSVEIFKSFRVSMDDPCHRVLPAALKKYNINEDWRLYALYIVFGDQERCLGLDERPLILFKQLEKEGRKPMFMLRKQAQLVDGQMVSGYQGPPGTTGAGGIGIMPGSAGFDGGTGGLASAGLGRSIQTNSIQLPGGVL